MPTTECLQAQLDAMAEREAERERRLRGLERERDETSGAVFAFAKVGAFVVFALGVFGAIVAGGLPAGVRRLIGCE